MRVLLIDILVKKNGKLSNTIHAEVNTIIKYIELYRRKGYKDTDIRRKLGKETLIVVRFNTIANQFKNSAPCANCIQYLKQFNIQKIMYSIDDGSLQFSRVKELDTTHISRGQRAINRMQSLNI